VGGRPDSEGVSSWQKKEYKYKKNETARRQRGGAAIKIWDVGILESWSNRTVRIERFINFLTRHSNVPLCP
jgi:hypothetical protein